MAVEGRLHEVIGASAGKLHTARSRNDQVATDVRLWLRTRIKMLRVEIQQLIEALVALSESQGKVLVPGYTHLQRGQPIWIAHQLLAHAWSFSRDWERFGDAYKRVNRSPLGSAAWQEPHYPIDRLRSAELLEFDSFIRNAWMVLLEIISRKCSYCAIVASSVSFARNHSLVDQRVFTCTFGDAWSTGSSSCHKKEPDAELIRGKPVGPWRIALFTLQRSSYGITEISKRIAKHCLMPFIRP